ncbi:hypothetical protein EMIHUDRAFT_194559 [Emiliania huxleyi CCMP1516]|uniref:F-box domain-containing protein n=2 Tax=Emiliania huxleyi TaxID=2903 RepID=A0A0D3L1R3_EMIH1|nr:hypothetical protein EMIHUDRAFT_194559 [Emiliania huxleyi CCMP1516]EOD41948.1 hypothetical protein EMIHUDRAFT_194559 [Emiliania huxleyi CCMP1516]|eukprot:XP_005794377.1 hypothetical protein EMIHUDRAFT_194559 [Emiliania huxleyi CCMP1516]
MGLALPTESLSSLAAAAAICTLAALAVGTALATRGLRAEAIEQDVARVRAARMRAQAKSHAALASAVLAGRAAEEQKARATEARTAAMASLASDASTCTVSTTGPIELPPELWLAVASYLDARSLVRFAQACRCLRACASTPSLWETLLERLGVTVEGCGPTAEAREGALPSAPAVGPRLLFSRARAAIAKNEGFYRSFRERDHLAMASLWLSDARPWPEREQISQFFPAGLLRDYPDLCAINDSWARGFGSGHDRLKHVRRITISPCGRLVRFALRERILSSRGIRTPGPGIASRNDFVLPQAGEGDEWPGHSQQELREAGNAGFKGTTYTFTNVDLSKLPPGSMGTYYLVNLPGNGAEGMTATASN